MSPKKKKYLSNLKFLIKEFSTLLINFLLISCSDGKKKKKKEWALWGLHSVGEKTRTFQMGLSSRAHWKRLRKRINGKLSLFLCLGKVLLFSCKCVDLFGCRDIRKCETLISFFWRAVGQFPLSVGVKPITFYSCVEIFYLTYI